MKCGYTNSHYASLILLAIIVFALSSNLLSQNKQFELKGYNSNIDHIVLIVEENRPESSIIGNPEAPYINKLAKLAAITTNYYSVSKNPYIALTSGSLTNIKNSCIPLTDGCQTEVANITDEIESSGRTWKMYAEGMPTPCYSKDFKKYVVRHNPFVFYKSINTDTRICNSNVVPFTDFKNDLNSSKLPNYVFISPDVCNDMHNCSTATGDKWLSEVVPMILTSSAFTKQRSLLIITWDEGNRSDNKVLTMFLGPAAKELYQSNKPYTHYSLLRTIEYVWGLEPLTNNDKHTTIMDDMLK